MKSGEVFNGVPDGAKVNNNGGKFAYRTYGYVRTKIKGRRRHLKKAVRKPIFGKGLLSFFRSLID